MRPNSGWLQLLRIAAVQQTLRDTELNDDEPLYWKFLRRTNLPPDDRMDPITPYSPVSCPYPPFFAKYIFQRT